MALRDLDDDELDDMVSQWFTEAGLAEWHDIAAVSMASVKMALNSNYELIQKINQDTASAIGEKLAEAISKQMTPAQLKKQIMTVDGLTSLVGANGRVYSLEERAATIARTELFRTYEEDKTTMAKEMLTDPIGIAQTAQDGSVRDSHRTWQDWAMRLDDWDKAPDKPGKMPNCRCTLIVMEAADYEGEIHDKLPSIFYRKAA